MVDETEQPVAGANAEMSWYVNRPDYSTTFAKAEGLTDTNGVFRTSHEANGSISLGFTASKAGYYPTTLDHAFHKFRDEDPEKLNPNVTLVLRPVGTPTPMYARNATIEVPEAGKGIGFDLTAYDWVAPYGKGQHSDFLLSVQRRWASRSDFESSVRVAFSNAGDGLIAAPAPLNQGGALRMGPTAPEQGYATELSRTLSRTPAGGWKEDSVKEQNYYFRVRTVLDGNGNVTSALYGKIHGDFGLDPINSKTVLVLFTYYLNPEPNSRNVEFDPQRNLFTHLRPGERVAQP